MKSLKITYVSPDELSVSPRNSRTHSAAQVEMLANSIREFGWTNPILTDGSGNVIAGAGRLAAAKLLGEKRVPTIPLSDLTPRQRRAYLIADNKIATKAGWDNAILLDELHDLQYDGFDLLLTGFEQQELDVLFSADEFLPGAAGDQGQLDKIKPDMVACPSCGTRFDAKKAGK